MAKNPFIVPKARPVRNLSSKKSAGILDDFAVRKNVATREGTIEKTPVNDSDITNKKYVDDHSGHGTIAYCNTEAEIIAAVADSDVGTIFIEPGDYGEFTATLTPTSRKRIIGIGFPRLALKSTDTYLFTLSGNDIVLEGLEFNDLNSYDHYAVRNQGDRNIIKDCHFQGNTVYGIRNDDDTLMIINCKIGSYIYAYAAINMINCNMSSRILMYGAGGTRITNCTLQAITIQQHSGYDYDYDMFISNTSFYNSGYCIFFNPISTNADITNIRFDNCQFTCPSGECIEVENSANWIEISNICFSNCIFKDSTDAFQIGANAVVSNWTFIGNHYDNITNRYDFTDPGSFVYINDGATSISTMQLTLPRVSQSAQPSPAVGCCMIHRDSDDNKTYLVYNDATEGVRQVELT